MCGIAGIITPQPVAETYLARSAALMCQRGPDMQGLLHQGPAHLAFRRLAIIDLSPAGNQPMANETGTVLVVFNGEIYNFQALRSQLKECHAFRSHTDTEVLVHGYEEWGFEGLLRRIDGMFAFAIWDEAKGELFLARDRVGKKPLYYASLPDGLAFASTLNALCALLPETPPIDPMALDQYLVYQAVPAPRTIYQGVSMLPPAHGAHWRAGQPLQLNRYWKLSYAHKQQRREADLLEELDGLVRGAVERRLIADVPLGAFLSGGVDSSLIVGVMSDLGAGPVESVIIGFEDEAYDERPYARQVAKRWGARLHEYVLQVNELQNLPAIIWQYGQPLADVSIVPTYAVARAAKEHVTVVLNGDGGDEAFGGYARPVVARAAQTYRALPRPVQRAGLGLLGRFGRRGHLLRQAAQAAPQEAFIYDRGLRLWRHELYTPDLLHPLNGTSPDALYAAAWQEADGPTEADHVLYGELATYLPDQLLVKMDVSTMAHALEARSPLLDTRLLEFAATIPTAQLMPRYQTKHILKRLAERYVPRDIIYRRKRGFVMPAAHWLRAELAPYVRVLLGAPAVSRRDLFQPRVVQRMVDEHLSAQRDWGNELWTLLVLEIWHRLFVDRTLSPTDRLEAIL